MNLFNKISLAETLLSFSIGTAISLVNKYVFDDWQFVAYLLVMVFLDTITGIRASLKTHTHSSNKLRQVLDKLFKYAVAIVAIHAFVSHTVDSHPNKIVELIAPGFKGGIYMLLLWTELISIEENLSKTNQGFLPRWMRIRMASWSETGKVEDNPSSEPGNPTETEQK